MIMTRFLWLLGYILDDIDITYTILHLSDFTCTILYLSLDIVTIYIVLWYWYTLFSLFDIDILDTDPDHVHRVTHYFVFALINEINQAEVIGGDW